MADSDFQKTGMLTRIQPDAEITRYQVLGERSSGTNYAKRLLGRNTALQPTEYLGWKHGFPHALAIPRDLLVVGTVRAADKWALSMHAKPWHTTGELQSLPFSEFIRAPWDTRIDRPRYFEHSEKNKTVGQVLQLDRHPLTGQKFADLFELRRAKLAGLLSYLDRDCSFVLLRMEDMIQRPQDCLDVIVQAIGQTRKSVEFRPVLKRLGSKFKAAIPNRPATPKEIPEEDFTYLKEQVNPAQEMALGYSY